MTSRASLAHVLLVSLAMLAGVGCSPSSSSSSPPTPTTDAGPVPVVDATSISGGEVLCQVGAKAIPSRPLTLTTTEVAVRLAQFLWQKPADAALLKRATTLRTTKDVAALASEMQKDARFGPGLDTFTNSWLELSNLPSVQPPEFVGFDAALAADMRESALRFVRSAFADPTGSVATLMTSPTVFFNARLAPLFGIQFDGAAGEWQQVMAPAGTRAGVSTLLARLTAAPRISARGIWIGSRLLCGGTTPPPPPGQLDEIPPSGGSYRQRLESITVDSRCAGCHSLFDNLGVAFEHFDDVGQFRKDDHGFAIDTQSSLSLDDQRVVAFDGAAELMRLMGESCQAEVCFVQSWLGQTLGSSTTPFVDADTVAMVLGAFRAANRRLPSLPGIITETPAFLAP